MNPDTFAIRSRTGGWYLLNTIEQRIEDWKHKRTLAKVPPLDDDELGEILDDGRMLATSYLPLLEQVYGKYSREFKDAKSVADAATDCGRPWAEKHPSNFPEDPSRGQLIADRLEEMSDLIRKQGQQINQLSRRRDSRASAQKERRVA